MSHEVRNPVIPIPDSFRNVLDLLNTPQQLLFGGISGAVTGRGVISGALQGAREDITGNTLLKRMGVGKLGKVSNLPLVGEAIDLVSDVPILGSTAKYIGGITGRGALGLTADILADPLLGVGKASRTLGVGAKLAQGAQRVTPARFGGMLGLSDDLEVVRELEKKAEFVFRGRKGSKINVDKKLTFELGKHAKLSGTSKEELSRRLALGVELNSPFVRSRVRKGLQELGVKNPTSAAVDEILAFNNTFETGEAAFKFSVAPRKVESIKAAKKKLSTQVTETRAAAEGKTLSETDRFIAAKVTELTRNDKGAIFLEKTTRGMQAVEMSTSTIAHFAHILTPDAQKILAKHKDFKGFAKRYSGVHGFQNARRWQGMTIDEINFKAANGTLKGLPKDANDVVIKIPKMFETDASKIQLARGLEGAKAIRDVTIFMESARLLGKRADEVDDLTDLTRLAVLQSTDPRLKELQGELADRWFTPEVAKHLDGYYRFTTGQSNDFLKVFDEVQSNWKALTLFVFPAYHNRNIVGNVFNNALAGLWNPEYYRRATKFQNMAPDSNEILRFANDFNITKMELDEMLANFGVGGQFSTFIGAEKGGGLFVQKVPVLGKGVDIGLGVGNALENNARIAHFMWQLDQGAKPLDAALSVKRYLFDYNDLTVFEKAVMRRGLPFYAWTRFNLPLQVRGIVDRPELYASIGDIIDVVEDEIPAPRDEDKLVAQWMKDNTQVRTRTDESGNPEYFMLGGWLPAADIERIYSPIKLLVDSMTPFAKLPIELVTGKDLFLGQDIERFPGEKEKFLGITASVKVTKSLKQLRLLTEFDRLLATVQETGVFGDTQVTSRKGDDLGPAVIRTLFGAKTFPLNVAARRRQLTFARREALRQQKVDRLRNRGINKDVLQNFIDNPELLDQF